MAINNRKELPNILWADSQRRFLVDDSASSAAAMAAVRQELAAAIASNRRKIVVLDDDPTGVQTVHGVSVYTGWDEASLEAGFRETAPLFFILTNSRSLVAAETESLHRTIARNLAAVSGRLGIPFILISRGDSTLRGHFPLETRVLAETLATVASPAGGSASIVFDGEILCPFFKEGGRFTIDDVHYVKMGDDLVPAGHTEFAQDKTFGYRSSNLRDWIAEKTEGTFPAASVVSIPLPLLRAADVDATAKILIAVSGFGKVIVNALDYSDLEVFAAAVYRAMTAGRRFIFRSAAALPKVLGGIVDRPLLSRADVADPAVSDGGLVVIGSHVKKTSAQLEALRDLEGLRFLELDTHLVLDERRFAAEVERIKKECDAALAAGSTVVVYTRRDRFDVNTGNKEDELRVAVAISDALTSIPASLKRKPRFIIGKGGITSSDIGTKALRVKRATVLGQILPGIPVWRTGEESLFPNTPYIIFPGNVGEVDSLKRIVALLM
jgi:uncharacterized protein YgbK (DUF1537 family)